jgi:hypothetical protein
MSKTKSSTVPPTVLVITLEADGSGSILARRGELAHLSQFTYHCLDEIVAAIQHGATQLMTVEENPPVVDNASASTPPTESVEQPAEVSDEITVVPPTTQPIAQAKLL